MHPGLLRMKETIARLMRSPWPSALVVCFFSFAALQEIDRHAGWKTGGAFGWDIEGYYHYLPAAFIRGDLQDLSYVAHIDSILHADGSQSRFGIHVHPGTRHDVIKFSCGTALFELPLFLVAHAYASLQDQYPADGYSLPYQLSIYLSTVLFVSLGLWTLRSFLRRHSTERDTVIAIATVAFGTNLFFYSTLNAGMSHGYVFFLFASVIDLSDRWHLRPQASIAALLGVTLGLTVLVRPVDGLVVLIPLLWKLLSNESGPSTYALVRKHPSHIALVVVLACIACTPQLLYWKHTTGEFIHYSYHGEGFDLVQPHIVDGLFSYRKGWLVYSPLVVIGLLGLGAMMLDRKTRWRALPIVIFLPVMAYVVFSWTQWWYGGSFGCRPLVPALALLALPIAHLARSLFAKHLVLGSGLVIIIALGIKLNMLQQNQYRLCIIHFDSMTKELYWEAVKRH